MSGLHFDRESKRICVGFCYGRLELKRKLRTTSVLGDKVLSLYRQTMFLDLQLPTSFMLQSFVGCRSRDGWDFSCGAS
jgi:hypothetical protein